MKGLVMWRIRDEREGGVGGAEMNHRRRKKKKKKLPLVISALSRCCIRTGNISVSEGRVSGWD